METTYRDYTIKIEPDDTPQNPRRDWDGLGTFAAFHGRYDLGDADHGLTVEECQEIEDSPEYISLPVYLYDHSGLRVSTSGFNCPWDSGRIGLIFISREDVRKEWGVKRISKKLEDRVLASLRAEIITYDQYLVGDIWGYIIEKDGEELDSCWGLYGSDYCLHEAKSIVDDFAKQRGEQLSLGL